MKYFIVLSAVILAASAMPADVTRVEEATYNSTRVGISGFATFGGGTRGGQGGAIWTVWDAWALRDAVAGNAARIIYVRGRIDLTVLFTGSPGVSIVVGNFKSIIGGDGNAEIFGGGLKTYYGQQVIVQNIKFNNALSYAPGEQPNGHGGIISMVPGAWSQVDAIDIEHTEFVWVDHCEFSDDPWHSASIPESQRRHDGLIDIKVASNWITISDNIFRNHNLVSLVGHSDANGGQDTGRLKVTFIRNWFMGTTQRNPRVRYGEVHIVNNLYTDVIDYGIGAGAGASIYAERNTFINTRSAWRHPAGVPSPMGYLLHVSNTFVNSNWDAVPSYGVRWNPSQYYWYSPIGAPNVEAHVRRYAGVWR